MFIIENNIIQFYNPHSIIDEAYINEFNPTKTIKKKLKFFFFLLLLF